jgi:hypothetical protein
MNVPIAITGLSALSPYGGDPAEICAESRSPIGRFATLDGPDTARFVGERLKRKLDRFAVLGLCAAGRVIEESGLLASGVDLERVGVFVGNCLGGWSFTEPELRRLHTQGVGAMSPYVATAWFPAALQGQISLAHGIKGHSKTFSHDIGGMTAIGHAMRAIANGRVDAAVCGAVESLDSEHVRAVLALGPEGRFAEGAAFLTLERLDRARERGARIYAVMGGYAERFEPDPDARAADASRLIREAAPEGGALIVRCGADAPRRFGQMFALSGVLETVCAAWNLSRRPLAWWTGEPWREAFDGAVILATGRSGTVAGLGILRAPPSPGNRKEEETRCLLTCG